MILNKWGTVMSSGKHAHNLDQWPCKNLSRMVADSSNKYRLI